MAGCAHDPPAAQVEHVHETGEPVYTRTMTDVQVQSIEQAFDSLAAGKTAVERPAPAQGMRWSDVPMAVVYACDDIEAAVVQSSEHDWGWEFTIRTVEDWPGTLQVRHTADPHAYTASATIGIYGDRTKRAQALLDALDKQLRAFAKKPQLPE
jgi:hypothetical protein